MLSCCTYLNIENKIIEFKMNVRTFWSGSFTSLFKRYLTAKGIILQSLDNSNMPILAIRVTSPNHRKASLLTNTRKITLKEK